MQKLFLVLLALSPIWLFGQKKIDFSLGGGLMAFSPQNYTYISYLPNRAPYPIIPQRQYLAFFPASLGLSSSFYTVSTKISLNASSGMNIAALLTTSGGGNYLALQIPTSLTAEINLGNVSTKTDNWVIQLGPAMVFSRLIGDGLIKNSSFLPALKIGFSKRLKKRRWELIYIQTFSSGLIDFGEEFPYGDNAFLIPGLDHDTPSLILRVILNSKKSTLDE